MKVSVAATGVSPTGRVVVVEDGRAVSPSTTLLDSKATLRLRFLRRGVHRLRVVYAGTATVAGARSEVLVLTVRPRR